MSESTANSGNNTVNSDSTSPPRKPPLHPVFTVTNIQNKVRVLDGTKVTYASWVRLFKLHAKGYKVLAHIDGTPPPSPDDDTYDAWCEIDAHVLQWIYGTLTDDLLSRVLEDDSTAHAAWTRVKNIFLNNMGARAAALEHEFNNLKLASMPSLEAYCQRLRELAGQLKDVDAAVNDQRLVLQLVRGLPPEFDTVASYVHQTMPSFETAQSMLELEQHRRAGREEPAAAMVVPPHQAPVQPETQPQQAGSGQRHGRFRGGGYRGGNRHRGRRHQSAASWGPPPPWVSQWSPPPAPYPAAPGWSTT